jgi:hypothetical protein
MGLAAAKRRCRGSTPTGRARLPKGREARAELSTLRRWRKLVRPVDAPSRGTAIDPRLGTSKGLTRRVNRYAPNSHAGTYRPFGSLALPVDAAATNHPTTFTTPAVLPPLLRSLASSGL